MPSCRNSRRRRNLAIFASDCGLIGMVVAHPEKVACPQLPGNYSVHCNNRQLRVFWIPPRDDTGNFVRAVPTFREVGVKLILNISYAYRNFLNKSLFNLFSNPILTPGWWMRRVRSEPPDIKETCVGIISIAGVPVPSIKYFVNGRCWWCCWQRWWGNCYQMSSGFGPQECKSCRTDS